MTFIFNLRAATLSTPVVTNLSKAGGTVKMIAELDGDGRSLLSGWCERPMHILHYCQSRGGGGFLSLWASFKAIGEPAPTVNRGVGAGFAE